MTFKPVSPGNRQAALALLPNQDVATKFIALELQTSHQLPPPESLSQETLPPLNNVATGDVPISDFIEESPLSSRKMDTANTSELPEQSLGPATDPTETEQAGPSTNLSLCEDKLPPASSPAATPSATEEPDTATVAHLPGDTVASGTGTNTHKRKARELEIHSKIFKAVVNEDGVLAELPKRSRVGTKK